MKPLAISLCLIQFFLCRSQPTSRYVTNISWGLGTFYEDNSPLDYLHLLRNDLKWKTNVDMIIVFPPPHDWVNELHVDELVKLVYFTDSTKSIVSVWSSTLPINKFSSIGREAQNLIEFFRADKSYKSYPATVTSFGPPDKGKAKELEMWWAAYKKEKGIQ